MDRPLQRADGLRQGRTVRSLGRTVCASFTEFCPLDQESLPKVGRSVPKGRRTAPIPVGSASCPKEVSGYFRVPFREVLRLTSRSYQVTLYCRRSALAGAGIAPARI